jgi:hypothetical protein
MDRYYLIYNQFIHWFLPNNISSWLSSAVNIYILLPPYEKKKNPP